MTKNNIQTAPSARTAATSARRGGPVEEAPGRARAAERPLEAVREHQGGDPGAARLAVPAGALGGVRVASYHLNDGGRHRGGDLPLSRPACEAREALREGWSGWTLPSKTRHGMGPPTPDQAHGGLDRSLERTVPPERVEKEVHGRRTAGGRVGEGQVGLKWTAWTTRWAARAGAVARSSGGSSSSRDAPGALRLPAGAPGGRNPGVLPAR